MGTESSCCAPSKNPMNLTEQLTGNRMFRQEKDPYANLEGYMPVDESEQYHKTSYQDTFLSSFDTPD